MTCGQPAPTTYAGVTGECDRRAGHPVYRGSTGLDTTVDVEMHSVRVGGVVIRWTDTDEHDRREIRCSANVARDQFWGPFK